MSKKHPLAAAALSAVALVIASCFFLAPQAPGQTVEFVGVGYNSTNTILSTNGVDWVQGGGLATNDSWGVTVYGNGIFVTISSSGDNMTAWSTNGIDWTTNAAMPYNDNWINAVFGDNLFVAIVEGDGKIAYSADGIHWSGTNAMPYSGDWYTLAYGNGVYVASEYGTAYNAYSYDGSNWFAGNGMPYSGDWQYMTYGNGVFAAIMGGSSLAAYSTDGINWSPASDLPYAGWTSMCYGDGKFVAMSWASTVMAYSTNGASWIEGTNVSNANWFLTTFADGIFVTLAQLDGHGAYSTNGVNWSSTTLPDSDTWYGLAARSQAVLITEQPVSQIVNAGTNVTFTVTAEGAPSPTYQWQYDGSNISGETTTSLTLTNVNGTNAGSYTVIVSNERGSQSSSQASLLVWPPTDVALFTAVAGANSNAIYSYDGKSWMTGPGMPWTADWSRVAYINGIFGAICYDQTNTAFSFDGRNWAAGPGTPYAGDWGGITYGNGMCVAVGNGAALWSTNGIDWTASTMPGGSASILWNSVAYGNGVFVALGLYCTNVVYSGDGIHWTNSPTGAAYSGNWNMIAYGNGVFAMLAGGSDTAAYSPNGLVWSNATGLPDDNWTSVSYGNGLFTAVAYGTDVTAYSSNGITWNESINAESADWYQTAFADGIFAAPAITGTNAAYSFDGVNWSNSPTGIPYTDVNTWYNVCANTTSTGYITNGQLAWWRLNDGSGPYAYDSSGNGFTLTNYPSTNLPTWGPDYLTFNGTNQYGDAGSGAASNLNYTDMTICAWVNKDGSSLKGIVDKSSPANYGTGYGLWVQPDGHLTFFLGYDTTSLIDDYPSTVIPGEWTFVSAVWSYQSEAVQFYYNAAKGDRKVANTGVLFASPQTLQVGNLQNNLSNGLYAFDGSMHDVAIYNRALSVTEIQSNFLATELVTNIAVPTPNGIYYK